ncbi:MAG: aminotransferase class I/II-fold pyridoxal phosphate-dependent enzyme [Chloroflexi bacterium]|nr:aminotransferase class I/II-fold pyridoxal phosphate-dependent enzyme [Chloroflexota bacterium]
MELFDKVEKFTIAKEAMKAGIYPYFQPLAGSEGSTATFRGREVIMLGSNNYLGLTTHPKVRAAAQRGIEEYGTSCTGSRFLNGTLQFHLELDKRLAEFVGAEAAIVFPTGYQTNLGTISSLVGKGDYVILDKDSHACIVDGALLSRGELRRFIHNDMDSLRAVLAKLPHDAGKLVVFDGVYSMSGDIAPLPEIVEICREYNARVMVDDAHSLGVLGGGRGTAAHYGMTMDDVDLVMGTFSKSFASIGGFVAGKADVIHYIQHNARSLIFSASLPAANAMTVLAALDIIENEPEHVQRVLDNADFMREGLRALGFNIGPSQTPIIPVIIGDDAIRTGLAWRALVDNGVYTNPVVPPAVPPSMTLLRTSYMATHTREHLQQALAIFETVGENLDLIPPKAERERSKNTVSA